MSKEIIEKINKLLGRYYESEDSFEQTDLAIELIQGHMNWLVKQAEKAIQYEKIIHNIANIDTLFLNPDGTERDWDDKEALKEIENMVTPIWNEHCEKSWEKYRQKAKENR